MNLSFLSRFDFIIVHKVLRFCSKYSIPIFSRWASLLKKFYQLKAPSRVHKLWWYLCRFAPEEHFLLEVSRASVSTTIVRLLAMACKGRPYLPIPWSHNSHIPQFSSLVCIHTWLHRSADIWGVAFLFASKKKLTEWIFRWSSCGNQGCKSSRGYKSIHIYW
jgi:hypothetical protein